MVTPLDLTQVEANAAEWLTKHREIDGKSAVTKMRADTWAIMDTPSGVFALCTEGVGPDGPVTDERPLTVEFWASAYADADEHTFISMFPSCTQKFGPDELRALATGKPVALHDFIRSFGSRLEANYSQWQRLLEKAQEVA
jgi:hypothetical protein